MDIGYDTGTSIKYDTGTGTWAKIEYPCNLDGKAAAEFMLGIRPTCYVYARDPRRSFHWPPRSNPL